MMTGIKNSVIYAIALTGLQTVLALPLAVLLDKKLKSRNLLKSCIFLSSSIQFINNRLLMEFYTFIIRLWFSK